MERTPRILILDKPVHRTAMIAALIFITFFPSLNNSFIWDDEAVVKINSELDRSDIFWLFNHDYYQVSKEMSYRPVVSLTHYFDRRAGPWGGHLFSMALHLFVVLALASLSRRILPSPAAELGAILFAVHPAWSEAIYVIGFREDLLCALFLLWTVILVLDARHFSAAVCFALALFSKEAAIPLPAFLLLMCRIPAFGHIKRSIPMLVLIEFVYLWIRFDVMQPPGKLEHVRWDWVAVQLDILVNYIRLFVFPSKLSIDHYVNPHLKPTFALAVMGVLIILVIGILTYFLRRRSSASWPIAWLIIFLAPVMNFVPIANPSAERYLYIPFQFLVAWIPHLVHKFSSHRRWAFGLILTVILLFAFRTHQRGYDFRDTRTLFLKEQSVNPHSFITAGGLGEQAYRDENFEEARKWLLHSLKEAPGFYSAKLWMGRVLMAEDRDTEAGEYFYQAYLDEPEDPLTILTLAAYFGQRGDTAGYLRLEEEAMKRPPDYPTVTSDLLKIYEEVRENYLRRKRSKEMEGGTANNTPFP